MSQPKKKKQINIDIGQRIKIQRELQKMTQEKLAENIEVSVQFVSDLERGVSGVSLTTLSRICEVLNVSSDTILLGKKSNYDNEISARTVNFTDEQKEIILKIIENVELFTQATKKKSD